jgi:hypothetical protein
MGSDPPDRSGLYMMGQHPTPGNRNLGPVLRSALKSRVEVYREPPLRYIRTPPELIDLRIGAAAAIPITAIIMSR